MEEYLPQIMHRGKPKEAKKPHYSSRKRLAQTGYLHFTRPCMYVCTRSTLKVRPLRVFFSRISVQDSEVYSEQNPKVSDPYARLFRIENHGGGGNLSNERNGVG